MSAKLRIRVALTALLALMADLKKAEGATVKFCFEYDTTYFDNGIVGEDYWLSDVERAARGLRVVVADSSFNTLFDGYLGDAIGAGDPGSGCTTTLTVGAVPGTYYYTFQSYGSVNGNMLRSLSSGGNSRLIFATKVLPAGSTPGTFGVLVDTSTYFAEFNVYAAAALALQRHGGGISGRALLFYCEADDGPFYCDRSTQSELCPAAEAVVLHENNYDKKFLIAHEMGHWIADIRTDGVMDHETVDVSYNHEPCSDDKHSMTSEEWAGGAAGEGFGNFYAANAWNDTEGSDCAFPLWDVQDGYQMVDCQDGNGDFVLAYHENMCGADTLRGVELDWLRAFWDVQTAGAAPDPTFTQVMNWMDNSGSWTYWNIYTVLDDRAQLETGDLRANWNTAKIENGVDH